MINIILGHNTFLTFLGHPYAPHGPAVAALDSAMDDAFFSLAEHPKGTNFEFLHYVWAGAPPAAKCRPRSWAARPLLVQSRPKQYATAGRVQAASSKTTELASGEPRTTCLSTPALLIASQCQLRRIVAYSNSLERNWRHSSSVKRRDDSVSRAARAEPSKFVGGGVRKRFVDGIFFDFCSGDFSKFVWVAPSFPNIVFDGPPL